MHVIQKGIYHTLKHNYWLGMEIDHLLKQIHQPDSNTSPAEPERTHTGSDTALPRPGPRPLI